MNNWDKFIIDSFNEIEHFLVVEASKTRNITIAYRKTSSHKLLSRVSKVVARLKLRKIKNYVNPALTNAPNFGVSFENPAQLLWRFQFFKEILLNINQIARLESLLEDEHSVETLKWLIHFRLSFPFLGQDVHKLYPGPVSPQFYSDCLSKATEIANKLNFIHKIPERFFICSWVLEHYTLKSVCEVENDDVVFDVGAYLGDTATYFASKCGLMGKVYSFEPSSSNASKLRDNVKNISNIVVIEKGVADYSGQSNFNENHAGGGISDVDNGNISVVEVITLDDFVSMENIKRVDFIKMDIEGAEKQALLGARKTINLYKPKMALSVYHLKDDLWRIIELVKHINEEYVFYLRHYTPWRAETTLFCVAKGK